MISASDAAAVKQKARSLGFDLAGFTHVGVPEEDRDFFLRWCERGLAGDMAWLARDPARRADPKSLLNEALGIITLGVSYFQGPVPAAPADPCGRVARYAWGEDYHDVIARRLETFQTFLKEKWGPGLKVRPAVDAQALLERAFARRSGVGFPGKNTNLIAPRVGSWIFLTELLVNLSLPPDQPVPPGCGECARCQTDCPTDALSVPHQLDARLCIAYHTIENRGWVPRELRSKFGSWLFGCDVCQDVCPFNARAKETMWPEFGAERGTGPWVRLADVLSLRTDELFKARFGRSPLKRAKRAGLVRNACLVAANTGRAGELRSLLEDCLGYDADPLVRGPAAWALGVSDPVKNQLLLDRARKSEPNAAVRSELEALLGGEVRPAAL